jgi:hypothetical protein
MLLCRGTDDLLKPMESSSYMNVRGLLRLEEDFFEITEMLQRAGIEVEQFHKESTKG